MATATGARNPAYRMKSLQVVLTPSPCQARGSTPKAPIQQRRTPPRADDDRPAPREPRRQVPAQRAQRVTRGGARDPVVRVEPSTRGREHDPQRRRAERREESATANHPAEPPRNSGRPAMSCAAYAEEAGRDAEGHPPGGDRRALVVGVREVGQQCRVRHADHREARVEEEVREAVIRGQPPRVGDRGIHHISAKARPNGSAPNSSQGRRRPQRLRVRSEMLPSTDR